MLSGPDTTRKDTKEPFPQHDMPLYTPQPAREYTREELIEAYREPKAPVCMLVDSDPIGEGMENIVFEGQLMEWIGINAHNLTGWTPKLGPNKWVVKVENGIKGKWRDREDYKHCRDNLKKPRGESNSPIPYTPTYVIPEILVYFKDGSSRTYKNALLSPYIANLDQKVIEYSKLMDPETGQETINELAEILVQAREMADESGYGIDMVGMESVKQIINAIPTGILLNMINALPAPIAALLRSIINGENVHIPNLVRRSNPTHPDKHVELIDIGPLILRKDPFIGYSLKYLFELSIAGLTEYTLTGNQSLAEKEGRAPNQEVIDKLERLKKASPQNRYYQIFAECTMRTIKPALEKSVQDKKPEWYETWQDIWKDMVSDIRAEIDQLKINAGIPIDNTPNHFARNPSETN